MEEIEVEEGEALSYQKRNEDSAVDPDINSLSYIEEKLQSVLGHFQKDFEGGVSAENLGAKFGGYGSFLPTYQRSPEVVHNTQKSPKTERKPNALASVSASPSAKSNTASGKDASTELVSKRRDKLQAGRADKLTLKGGSNEKPISSLKLLIKVGSENLLKQKKNVDIYNGLGLVSPSSSLDDSPSTSEWQNRKVMDMLNESPTSILKIMTSFPVDALLSPLSEDLIQLNRKHRGKHEGRYTAKTSTSAEKLVVLVNGFHSSRSNEKAPEAKRLKFSAPELADRINSSDDKKVLPLKKECKTDDDAVLCEDIVSNALKLPLLCSYEFGSTDPGKDMPFATNAPAHSLRNGMNREMLSSSIPARDTGRVGNSGKLESLSTNATGPAMVSQMDEASHPLDQSDFSGSKLKKTCSTGETSDVSNQLVFHNGGSMRPEDVKPSIELSPIGDSKKLKAANTSGYDSYEPKKENEKPADRYKDFFGEEEFDDDDDDEDNKESLSGELASAGRLKGHHLSVKTSCNSHHGMPKERCNIKSPRNPQSKEKYPRISSHPDNPVVKCDLCQIWRLHPLGTDPNLPEKWTCSMMTWLPGMNRCYIPEEHTTNAFRALYHPAVAAPAPISEGKQIGVTAGYPDQEHPTIAVKTTSSGKKKSGSTRATISTELDGPTRSASSKKKTLITTGKSSNLSGGNSSPSTDAGIYQLGRSSSEPEKFENGKRKMSVVNYPERGTQISVKSKQEDDLEGSKASKRTKREERHFDDERLIGNNAGPSLKGDNASTSFSNNTSENEHRKSRHRISSVDKKTLISDVQVEAYAPSSANNASVHSWKHDEKDTVRERRSKEYSDPESHLEKRSRTSKPDKVSNVESGRKSDVGALQPLVASNSSSSKVSGSQKNKTGKGSPVESVSSSPQRYYDAGKVSSTVINLVGNLGDGGSNGQAELKKNEDLACASTISGFNDNLGQNSPFSGAKNSSDQRKVDGNTNNGQSLDSGFHLKKSGKHSKAISQASERDLEKVSNRPFDSSHDSLDHRQSYDEKLKSRRNKPDEKSGTTNRGEKSISRKETSGGTPNENTKAQVRRYADDGQDATKSLERRHEIRDHDIEKLSQKSNSEAHVNVKSHSLPPLARINNETAANHEPVSRSQKDEGANVSAANEFDSGNAQKVQGQKMKSEKSNCLPFRLSTPISHKVRDTDYSSPARREPPSHVINSIMKEATDLKHTADRMKNSGSLEGISLYMQACLKFLHGVSLMESASKHNELANSMSIYSSTAKLCEYCAHEYEKSKDMAAAALAYKCVEVAYMRVVYSNNPSASRDRNELQSSLQIAAHGDSPSSSASDVDSLNHQTSAPEKSALVRIGGSPHVSGGHVISSRNRAGFSCLLDFAQNVNLAMEASRKSRVAFTAALSRFTETSNEEAMSSLRKALNYTFQDVEVFLRLVRLAMETLSS